MRDFALLIDGALVEGAGTRWVINPATEEPFAAAPIASATQVDQAVAAAGAAFPGWSARAADQRRAVLDRIADIVEAHADTLARLLTQEQGKPLDAARAETLRAAATFRGAAAFLPEDRAFDDGMGRRVILRRRPLGVVAAIVPWNVPLGLMANKVAAALITGNTVVVKPAPTTPLSTLHFGRLVRDAVPRGVLNVIADDGALGAVLATHPGVRKISFTGSTPTGKRVMAGAAKDLKRVTLELGGNDAAIVLDDADPAATAEGLFNGAFRNSGQVCVAIKRAYVHDSLYDTLCAALARLCAAAVVGDGLEPGTRFGPLQNRAQYERVTALIDEARAHGTVLGDEGPLPGRGYFVRPCVVRDITDGTRLVDEEQFGPVLPLIRYHDVDDAVRRANASPHGLGGSIWSSDPDRALAVAARMDTGNVWINRHPDLAPHLPFAGAKQSGIGVEMGVEGLMEFTQLQLIGARAADG